MLKTKSINKSINDQTKLKNENSIQIQNKTHNKK